MMPAWFLWHLRLVVTTGCWKGGTTSYHLHMTVIHLPGSTSGLLHSSYARHCRSQAPGQQVSLHKGNWSRGERWGFDGPSHVGWNLSRMFVLPLCGSFWLSLDLTLLETVLAIPAQPGTFETMMFLFSRWGYMLKNVEKIVPMGILTAAFNANPIAKHQTSSSSQLLIAGFLFMHALFVYILI